MWSRSAVLNDRHEWSRYLADRFRLAPMPEVLAGRLVRFVA